MVEKNKRNGITEEHTNTIYLMRGIAICYVICAHVQLVTRGNSVAFYSAHVLNNLGSIGVGIFYLLSGYCFHPWKYDFGQLMKNKIVNIGIPWIIVGTVVWLYEALRKGGITVTAWLQFMVGYNSYLYYLTNLILFFILFYFLYKLKLHKKACIIIYIALCVVSWSAIFLESEGISFFPTLYLDPFVFLIYFVMGYILQGNEVFLNNRFLNSPIWMIMLVLPFTVFDFAYALNLWSPVFEFGFILGTFALTKILVKTEKLLCWMGKQSLAIYLLHMPIAGIVAYVFNSTLDLQYIDLLRPIVTLVITSIGVIFISDITRQLHINWLDKALGIKKC